MRLSCRIKKLERQMEDKKGVWTIFSVGYYEDKQREGKVKDRLLADYLANGNQSPDYCVFVNEIPGKTSYFQEEKFYGSFEATPLFTSADKHC